MVGEDKRPKASPAFVREPAPDGDDEGPDDVRAWGHVLGFEGVTRPSRSGRLVRRVTRPCATALDTGQHTVTGRAPRAPTGAMRGHAPTPPHPSAPPGPPHPSAPPGPPHPSAPTRPALGADSVPHVSTPRAAAPPPARAVARLCAVSSTSLGMYENTPTSLRACSDVLTLLKRSARCQVSINFRLSERISSAAGSSPVRVSSAAVGGPRRQPKQRRGRQASAAPVGRLKCKERRAGRDVTRGT